MKKLLFLVGVGIGFLLGSRSGRQPYEQVEAKVRQAVGRPEVQQVVGKAKAAAGQSAQSAASQVSDTLDQASGAVP